MPMTNRVVAIACRLVSHRRTGLLCLTLICLSAGGVVKEEPYQKPLPAAIDALVRQQIKSYNVPGLSIAIGRQGRIFFSRSYGWADIENRVPVTTQTLFRIGSITKPITATAAMILARQHQLDLDAPVQRYCEAFPEKAYPVTTRKLLAHLGGIRGFHMENGTSPELFSDIHYDHLADSVTLFANDPLVGKPGSRYEYSNYGYDLIGCVLEGASREEFGDLLRRVVFVPSGMVATRLDDSIRIIPNRSRSYTHLKNGTLTNARYLDTSNRIAAAGLLSTANDLARFSLSLESGKLLSGAELQSMWTEQATDGGQRTGYALGWMIHVGNNHAPVVAHTGEQPGASSILYVIPNNRICIAVVANSDAAGLWKLADGLANLLGDSNDSSHK